MLAILHTRHNSKTSMARKSSAPATDTPVPDTTSATDMDNTGDAAPAKKRGGKKASATTPTTTATTSPSSETPKLNVKDTKLIDTLAKMKQVAANQNDAALTTEIEEFSDEFSKVLAWKKKTMKQQRKEKKAQNGDEKAHAPTAYNTFVKETMAKLRDEMPDLDNKNRMVVCSERWNAQKASLAAGEDVEGAGGEDESAAA